VHNDDARLLLGHLGSPGGTTKEITVVTEHKQQINNDRFHYYLPLLGWVVLVFWQNLNCLRIADQERLRKAHKEPFVAQANAFLAVDAFNATIVDPSSVNLLAHLFLGRNRPPVPSFE
jgi:hypothetical protein